MDGVLVRHGAARFLHGLLWRRPWAWADSRAVGAHLSTADLVGLWVDLPATTLRFLAGNRGDRGKMGDHRRPGGGLARQ